MADSLEASLRETRGKRSARRERAAGKIPAILYGHGEETVSVSVPADQVDAVIRHGSQVVDLKGAVTESALIRDVQWDPLGVDVLHLDLFRVRAGEVVEVTVPVETRGVAPGVRDGGIVAVLVHELEIECPVMSIPDKITVNINHLELDGSITAGELPLPEGAKLLIDAEEVVVSCHEPEVIEEEEEGVVSPEAGEPEIIGRDEEDEAGGEGEDSD